MVELERSKTSASISVGVFVLPKMALKALFCHQEFSFSFVSLVLKIILPT